MQYPDSVIKKIDAKISETKFSVIAEAGFLETDPAKQSQRWTYYAQCVWINEVNIRIKVDLKPNYRSVLYGTYLTSFLKTHY